MALPKKKTSKSRSKRRFAQYSYNRKNKLQKVVDSLMHIGKPFIYDSSAAKKLKKDKIAENEQLKESTVSKKVEIEKVEKIDVKKAEKKDDKKIEKKEDIKVEDNKGKWFSNIFSKKNQDNSKMRDLGGGSGKKVHRRKSM